MIPCTEHVITRAGTRILVALFGGHACATRLVPLDGMPDTSRAERPDDAELDDVRACLGWHGAEERSGPSPSVGRWLWRTT